MNQPIPPDDTSLLRMNRSSKTSKREELLDISIADC